MRAFKAVNEYAGVVQWLESQPSKLVVWVRFPSPAPYKGYKKDIAPENPDSNGVLPFNGAKF